MKQTNWENLKAVFNEYYDHVTQWITRIVPNIINCNKSALVEGRYIGDVVQTVADIVHFYNR